MNSLEAFEVRLHLRYRTMPLVGLMRRPQRWCLNASSALRSTSHAAGRFWAQKDQECDMAESTQRPFGVFLSFRRPKKDKCFDMPNVALRLPMFQPQNYKSLPRAPLLEIIGIWPAFFFVRPHPPGSVAAGSLGNPTNRNQRENAFASMGKPPAASKSSVMRKLCELDIRLILQSNCKRFALPASARMLLACF